MIVLRNLSNSKEFLQALQTLAVRIETNCNKTSLGRTYNNCLLGAVVERVRCLAEMGLVILTGTVKL
jgi:hypothetical protein